MEKKLYSAKDLIKVTGLSQSTVYNMFHMEGFPVINVGRRKLVPIEAFNRWLETQTSSLFIENARGE